MFRLLQHLLDERHLVARLEPQHLLAVAIHVVGPFSRVEVQATSLKAILSAGPV